MFIKPGVSVAPAFEKDVRSHIQGHPRLCTASTQETLFVGVLDLAFSFSFLILWFFIAGSHSVAQNGL